MTKPQTGEELRSYLSKKLLDATDPQNPEIGPNSSGLLIRGDELQRIDPLIEKLPSEEVRRTVRARFSIMPKYQALEHLRRVELAGSPKVFDELAAVLLERDIESEFNPPALDYANPEGR